MLSRIKKYIPEFIFDLYHLGWLWSGKILYGKYAKKLTVIGIVGSKGKSTTTNIIWQMMNHSGIKTAMFGTASMGFGLQQLPNDLHMTMPGKWYLFQFAKKAVEKNCTHLVLEVPSEAVEHFRHKAFSYDMLIFLNLTPERQAIHHRSVERMEQKTMQIFKDQKPGKTPNIVCTKEENYTLPFWKKIEALSSHPVIYFGTQENILENIESTVSHVSFTLNKKQYKAPLAGSFNAVNIAAAILALKQYKIEEESIQPLLDNLERVPGRMEEVQSHPFRIMVDYAHEPLSMEKALQSCRSWIEKDKKVIVLLGAEGGGRDRIKRPLMGEIAGKLADRVILSNVDPYEDDQMEIISDIAVGAKKAGKEEGKNLFLLVDRKKGIEKCISEADEGDIIIITGKGSEQNMIVQKKFIPWNDREVIESILKEK